MSSIALVSAASGFVIERQNAASLETFGPLEGRAWMTLAPPEMATLGFRAIEETLDTGRLVRYDTETEHGWGRTSVLALRTGKVLTSWRPLTGQERITDHPRVHENAALCRLAAEHLDRLDWALREGRPLPHLPAALRPSRGSDPGVR
jgi:hypothetical protein